MPVKKLAELKVVDLKRELEEAELETTGTKATLVARLRNYLESRGEDPDTFQFEVPGSVDTELLLRTLREENKAMSQVLREENQAMSQALSQKLDDTSRAIQEDLTKLVTDTTTTRRT